MLEQAMDELAAALEHRPARAPPPESRRARPGLGAALLEQAAARLLRPRRGARALGRAGRAARAAAGRPASRDGLRDADLVGRRRPAGARDDPTRRGRPRARHDRDPGHRHRHAHVRAHGRGRGARARPRARRRARRRHRPERLRPGLGRLDDHACGDAGGAERRREGAPHPPLARRGRAGDLARRPDDARRADPLERRRARRRRDRGDGEARERDDRRHRHTRPEPRRLPREHLRLPDRTGRRRSRDGRRSRGTRGRGARRRPDRQPAGARRASSRAG